MKNKIIFLLLVLVCLSFTFALISCDQNSDDDRPEYTVTFDAAGGTFDGETTIKVKEGDKIPLPKDPVFDGKTFTGWYTGKRANTKWNFEEQVVTEDVTLTAWYLTKNTCLHERTEKLEDKSYDATCTKKGLEVVKCTYCRLQIKTSIPATGHSIIEETVPVTCGTDGYDRKYCENCDYNVVSNEQKATGDHNFSSGYVTVLSATKYTSGIEAKICEVCQAQDPIAIPPLAELDEILGNIDIGNYTYTGGKYENAPFVNIAKYAGTFASSYYTVCYSKYVNDGGTGTYWCADTLADGSTFTGDNLILDFVDYFDIGLVKVLVPHYYAWELGEDCYVSYDLQAMIDGEWKTIGNLSDKNAVASGTSGAIVIEFSEPVYTNALRFVVTNSSRYTPAMIYEIDVMAATEETERVVSDLSASSILSSSGKYNAYADGIEKALDGSYATAWNTNYREKMQGIVDEVYATISYSEKTFVASTQFVVTPTSNKSFSLYYMGDDGEWVKIGKYEVKSGNKISYSEGGELIENNRKKYVVFTANVEKFTTGIKLVVENDLYYDSFIYEFNTYTVVEQAFGVDEYLGCAHNAYKTVEVVLPTCSNSGYTIMECYGCGKKSNSDAVDAYGHKWGEYTIDTPAKAATAGTKVSKCINCDAQRTTNYYNEYDDIKVTTYKNNAPAAWAQTLDDGNYISTYEWLIPKLQHYGWKATAALAICFSDIYVEKWQGYFATGALDLASHSDTHGGYYAGKINESSLLSDVNNAHYWFMNKYAGQRILTFATPNGTTSVGTSDFVNGIMAAARNGGGTSRFYNLIEDFIGEAQLDKETGEQLKDENGLLLFETTRRAWGDMYSYISKFDEHEGMYMFVDKNGKYVTDGSSTNYLGVFNTNGSFGKFQTGVDKNGNPVYGWDGWLEGYNVDSNGIFSFTENEYGDKSPNGGSHVVVRNLSGKYFIIEKGSVGDYSSPKNYVYDSETNRLVSQTDISGTYEYIETRDSNGKITDSMYVWRDSGSYVKKDGKLVYDANDNSGYRIWHTTLGTYEEGIAQILDAGGMTVECLHAIEASTEVLGGMIHASYVSNNSKFIYLEQTGIWVCSYTELVQYMKEQLNSTVETISRSENEVVFNLTDTLDDIMFNYALTVEVDVDDSWTEENITATQNGEAVEFFMENGYVYVNAVPDRGNVVISYNG